MSTSLHYLLSIIVPLTLRTGIYFSVFHWRKIEATLLTCIILAGTSILVAELQIVPMFGGLAPLFSLAIAMYLCTHYTGVPLIPVALVIVASVEVVSYLLLKFNISPLIF